MTPRSLLILDVTRPVADRYVVTYALQGGHLWQGVCDVKVGIVDPYRESQPLRSVSLVDTRVPVDRLLSKSPLALKHHVWHPIDDDMSADERCLVDLLSRL